MSEQRQMADRRRLLGLYVCGFSIAAIAAWVGFFVSGTAVGALIGIAVACVPLVVLSVVSSARRLMRESRQAGAEDQS